VGSRRISTNNCSQLGRSNGLFMRKGIFVKGLIVFMIGAALVALGIFTQRIETTVTAEDALEGAYNYDFLGNHEYEATIYLLPGTYELHYNLSSSETVREFYVSVLDPDGYEIKSIYGPPVPYQYQGANLTFETQKIGQHTFILGGLWTSVQVKLFRLMTSTEIVYPLIISFYAGLPLFAGGTIVGIFGALMKEKPTYWYDKI
jgi:hypothetical protein